MVRNYSIDESHPTPNERSSQEDGHSARPLENHFSSPRNGGAERLALDQDRGLIGLASLSP